MPKNPKWVEELQSKDKESAKKLNDLLLSIARHKGVYSLSGDPAIAQLWVALIELSQRQEKLEKEISELKDAGAPKVKEFLKKKRASEILEALENY